MATDITTLAISLQSQEAENSLKNFNELLALGSKSAKSMERVTIGVDVKAALKELSALQQSYEAIAKTAQNIHFDMGTNAFRPEMFAPPPVQPQTDVSEFEVLKNFFHDMAEDLQSQSASILESTEKIGNGAERVGTAIQATGENMRGSTISAGEYAAKLRDLNAAKAEWDALSSRSNADMIEAVAADQKAAEAKRNLTQAQDELNQVTQRITRAGEEGASPELIAREKELRTQIQGLSEAYRFAQSEAEQFVLKLSDSSEKAEHARNLYNQLKTELDGIKTPVINPPVVDTAELQQQKAVFHETAEELRKQSESINSNVENISASASKMGDAARSSGDAMNAASDSASHYTETLRAMNAAKKEMESYAAKEDSDRLAAVESDKKAAEAKRELIRAQKELKQATDEIARSKNSSLNDDAQLTGRKEALQAEVKSLTDAYQKVQNEADQFGARLEASAAKTEEVRARYNELKQELATIQAPTIHPPVIDESELQAQKSVFNEATEEMRSKADAVENTMAKLGAGTERFGASVHTAGESMRTTTVSAGEYAAKLRELNSAKDEWNKLAGISDADMRLTVEADTRAAEAKRNLAQAQQELNTVKQQISTAGEAGASAELIARETELKNQILGLTETYRNAQAEADKFGANLEASSAKADAARMQYNQLKSEIEGMKTPTIHPPVLDTDELEDQKAVFHETAEELRKEAADINKEVGEIGASAERMGSTMASSGESVRVGTEAAKEYNAMLREVNAAKKAMEKADARANYDKKKYTESLLEERDIRRELIQLERKLADARKQQGAAYRRGENTEEQVRQINALKAEIDSLSPVYAKTKSETAKFEKALESSAEKAVFAKEEYRRLKAELQSMPAPNTASVTKQVDDFQKSAQSAGRSVTKLARGFNSLALIGGTAVPGLNKLGMAISMFAYTNPYVAGAVVGLNLLVTVIQKFREQSEIEAQRIRESAERALKSSQEVRQFVSESENDWNRLGELSSVTELSNAQNQEASAIIERLTETYGDLGIEIDKTNGKLKGYAEARAYANKQDIELQKSELEYSASRAQENFEKVIEDFKKNAGRIYSVFNTARLFDDTRIDYFQDSADNLIKMLSDSIVGENIKIDEFRRLIEDAEAIRRGDKTVEYRDESRGDIDVFRNVSANEAEAYIALIEKVKEAYISARDAKKTLEKFDTEGVEKYAQEAGKIAARIADAEKKFKTDEDGMLQLKTAEDIYRGQKDRIAAIEAERADVEKKAAEDEMQILNNGKQAGIYLKELELERLDLIEKTLNYEQRVSAEKERERKTLNNAIDAEQARLNTLKLGYKYDGTGNLLRKKTEEELELDRLDNIAAARERIAELEGKGTDKQTLEDLKALTSARLELANLQAEQLAYEKRITDENEKQAEAERKKIDAAKEQLKAVSDAYAIDKKTGLFREKNADEKANDRLAEINDLKAKIKQLSATAARRDATKEDLLEWGKRYNPATGKMNGAQKQAGWRGVLSDGRGGVMTEVSVGTKINNKEVEIPLIIPNSTEEDLVRIAKIANGEITKVPDDLLEKAVDFAKKRLAEGKSAFFNGDKADEALRNVNVDAEAFAKLAEAQAQLLKLQADQGKYAESVKTTQSQNADKFKDYWFDKNGAVLRKKTDEELRNERKKQLKEELKAAREQLKASEKGTLEYENARAKLTDLEIESYNLRKKSNAAEMLNETRASNTRMVQGIEARSTAAMALEARNFRSDESEKNILKETKGVQTDIRDVVQRMFNSVSNFESTFSTINDKLQPV